MSYVDNSVESGRKRYLSIACLAVVLILLAAGVVVCLLLWTSISTTTVGFSPKSESRTPANALPDYGEDCSGFTYRLTNPTHMISPGEKLLRLIFGWKTRSKIDRCKDSDDFISMTELTCLTKKFLIEPGPERLISLDSKLGFDRMVHTFVTKYFFNCRTYELHEPVST